MTEDQKLFSKKFYSEYFYHSDLFPINKNLINNNISTKLISNFFINIFKVLYYLLINLNFNNKKLNLNNNVFISHINPSFKFDKREKYFGKLIRNKDMIIYISHDKEQKKIPEHIIFPKSLHFFLELKILWKLIKDFKSLLEVLLKKKQNKKKYVKLIINLITPLSTLNLRYYYAFKEVYKNENLKHIFITFEGHCYERAIIKSMKEQGKKIYAYQHGAINEENLSIFMKLKKNLMPDKILTSGLITYQYFINKKFNDYELNIVGSNRYNPIIKNEKKLNKNILVIPDGTLNETQLLFDFIKKISVKNKQYKFYFKMHPDAIFKKKFIGNHSIIIINKNIRNFYNKTSFVLYSNSSYVINCVKNNMIPLYYNHIIDNNVLQKFSKYIEIDDNFLINVKLNNYKIIKNELLEFAKNYYLNYNYENIKELSN